MWKTNNNNNDEDNNNNNNNNNDDDDDNNNNCLFILGNNVHLKSLHNVKNKTFTHKQMY